MENAKLLHAIIKTALDGIITVDSSGMMEYVSPSAHRIFGYPNGELLGRNISLLLPGPDGNSQFQSIPNGHKNGEKNIIGKEVIGVRKDGIKFPLRIAVSEVKYRDRTIYTGVLHDLTGDSETEGTLKKYAGGLEESVAERTESLELMLAELQKAKEELHRALENEKEVSRLKSRFVSMASHEFRTPLSAMQLSVVLIEKYLEMPDRAQILKHLHQLKNSIGNMNAILNEFLSVEELEIGVITPGDDPFDVVQFAEELTEEMQLITKTNQIIIYQHTGSESLVSLDRHLIRHCLVNLITNAVKYSGENTLIEFSTGITADSYLFTVKDNGIGIPEKDHAFIFKPFFRAHNTGKIPGTGLGLNIVERYVNLMNGKILFTSSPGLGTQFIVSFPKKPVKIL